MSVSDLDKSGNVSQVAKVILGPTIGNVLLPIIPETFVNVGPSYVCQPFDSRILLNATVTPVTSVTLPDVTKWVLAPFQENRASFERSIWVKDFAYKATTNPITITPFAGQFIDGLPSFQIVTEGLLIRLYPLNDLTGWFVG